MSRRKKRKAFKHQPQGWAVVYALEDPRRPGEYRYCGRTEQTLRARLALHITRAWNPYERACRGRPSAWTHQLLLEGVEPNPVTIEFCEEHRQWDLENYHTHRLRRDGHDILNDCVTNKGADRGPIENPLDDGDPEFGGQLRLWA